jgi:SET domain-containing protein
MSETNTDETWLQAGLPIESPQFSNPLVAVKQSLIHGMGLFAQRTILEGAQIGLYEGAEVESDEEGDHVLWIYDEDEEREYGIDGQNETRFVNHCRSANAAFYGEELVALRTISVGEEITHDYGEAWSALG